MKRGRRREIVNWATLALLIGLCAVAAVVQYRWIGEISETEREHLQENVVARLDLIRQSFNSSINAALIALEPDQATLELRGKDAFVDRYLRWNRAERHWFRRIAVAATEKGSPVLYDLTFQAGELTRLDWPDDWKALQASLTAAPGGPGRPRVDLRSLPPAVLAVPSMALDLRNPNERIWLIAELDLAALRGSVFPELTQRHLSTAGSFDYEVKIVAEPSQTLIYQSTVAAQEPARFTADASVTIFEGFPGEFGPGGPGRGARGIPPMRSFRPGTSGGAGGGFGGRGGPPGARPDPGMRFERPEMFRGRRGGMLEGSGRIWPRILHAGPWNLMVRHRAGSLDALVQRARWRNLAVSGGVLALLIAAVGAMVRASRRAQKTAELQMNFVAGISHELRTPLTVLRTAGFNLHSGVSRKPEQVEQYGKLVQEESEKLGRLVEQILRFAASDAGSLIRSREPVAVEPLIESSLEAIEIVSEHTEIAIERRIDPDLPPVLADAMALKHAIQNLIDNAMKYGASKEKPICLSACSVPGANPPAVEISVSDHGPGIPPEELNSVFDAFFRGRGAVQAQIHGAGLGLNLVRKIAEAHGGSVSVRSEVGKGATFTLRIPAAAKEEDAR